MPAADFELLDIADDLTTTKAPVGTMDRSKERTTVAGFARRERPAG